MERLVYSVRVSRRDGIEMKPIGVPCPCASRSEALEVVNFLRGIFGLMQINDMSFKLYWYRENTNET